MQNQSIEALFNPAALAASFWNVFAMMAPWLLFGFLIAGIIAVCIPRSFVIKTLGGASGMKSVLRAVLIGVPLPVCSCGVIPISGALHKNGASKGATAAFLISTPQTGIDSILATYALLGPVFAVARPVAAFVTGMIGGGVVHLLTGGASPRESGTAQSFSNEAGRKGLRAILWQGYVRLLGSVIKPLLIGLAISAAVTHFVPDDFFAGGIAGSDWLAMPLMALLGIPMYVCSTAAIPIALSLLAKGVSPGAAFVFLMTGPAINAVSLATIAAMIGKRAAVAYTATIIAGALIFGIAINALPDSISAIDFTGGCCREIPAINHASAIALALLMANALYRFPKMK